MEAQKREVITVNRKKTLEKSGVFLYAKNRKENNMGYQINLEYVVFDENMEVVDWFDTLEAAEEYVEQIKEENE